MKKDKKEIVYCLISGGVLQAAWSTSPNVSDLVLIDEDNRNCDDFAKRDNEKLSAKIGVGNKIERVFGGGEVIEIKTFI